MLPPVLYGALVFCSTYHEDWGCAGSTTRRSFVFDPKNQKVHYFQKIDSQKTTHQEAGFKVKGSKVVFEPPIQYHTPSDYGDQAGKPEQIRSVQMKPRHIGLCIVDEKGDRFDQNTRKEKDDLFKER